MGFVPITEGYPWDRLAPYIATAEAHPDGAVDLSIGTPVDPTPAIVQEALVAAADSPGYPTVVGTPALRTAIVEWFARRRGVVGLTPEGVMPTIGSKEIVGLLPSLLGIGPGDVVVVPASAYPTYAVGAQAAGAQVLATDDVSDWEHDGRVKLVWMNTPGNPTGAVASVESLRAVVGAARRLGAVVASDECYAELPWTEPWVTEGVPCLLDPRVAGESLEGLLVAYSLSKQSNLAGYRAAMLAGDPDLLGPIILMRRHLGMMMPRPVQEAMTVALNDDDHVQVQREIYRRRREQLLPAVRAAGFTIDHSDAGLYLWARADDGADCWTSLGRLAELGIIAGAGEFYGQGSEHHVRFALTAPDAAVASAARRLTHGQ